MTKPKSNILDKDATLIMILTWVVGEMASELMTADVLKRQDFKAALERMRRDVSTRSDLDSVAAKALLKTFLLLADPNYQEP